MEPLDSVSVLLVTPVSPVMKVRLYYLFSQLAKALACNKSLCCDYTCVLLIVIVCLSQECASHLV